MAVLVPEEEEEQKKQVVLVVELLRQADESFCLVFRRKRLNVHVRDFEQAMEEVLDSYHLLNNFLEMEEGE
jgi:hypothetical protein